MKLKRKLYKRGSSYETTIPLPLLFSIKDKKKYHVVFEFDEEQKKWYVDFESIEKEHKNENTDEILKYD
ncbi:MAG: hypothetical protein ABIC91_02640 [Nanoarchaeota archaeon]|nr:hypothetical protein [Nanoarchaeota archaeon]MBU1029845.1 hypothetical protein [Nanoarchaeota archaeon]MBU1849429.1 hypothetical protein [Nanoarchaeota archaeon]